MPKKPIPTNDGDHDPRPQYCPHPHRDISLELLRLIDVHPTWTQRQLSKVLGVSLGKTNYCVRALKEKGLVKWGNFTQNPNKLAYLHILTPQGVAHKLRLTAHFLACKEAEYNRLRAEIAALRQELLPNDTDPRQVIDDRSLERAGAKAMPEKRTPFRTMVYMGQAPVSHLGAVESRVMGADKQVDAINAQDGHARERALAGLG